MKQLFMAAASAAAALALTSCNPKELIVKDNSALEKIAIQVSNDTPKWEYGEERLFTIVPTPNTAHVSEYKLLFSNPEIVTMDAGELPNQFKVTAAGEGKLIVTASAKGHGEIPGQTGNNWSVERTETTEFTLQDTRVKPKRPVVTLQLAPSTDIASKKELAEDTPITIADKQDMLLTVSSDSDRATYSMKSLDNEVFTVERSGAQSWMLRTKKPGRDFLKLTLTDAEGNPFDYYYLIYSFGHVTMTAEYDPMMAEAGISINEHGYTKLSGQVYMAGTIKGWPWNDVNNIVTKEIPTFNGAVDFTWDEDQDPIVLADTYDIQQEIYAMTAGSGLDKAWFTPHEARLNYLITLNNPFIIIDDLIDDSYRSEPLWWNFFIEGALQQEGVTPVEMLSHEPITFNPGVDGWQDGTEIEIPL